MINGIDFGIPKFEYLKTETRLRFSKESGLWEYALFEIFELKMSQEQEQILSSKVIHKHKAVHKFATEDIIRGECQLNRKLKIGDHAKYIL